MKHRVEALLDRLPQEVDGALILSPVNQMCIRDRYVADYTSCDRQYEGVEHMRELAKVSLEDAMREGLRFTIQELSGLERTIHPNTIFAYNELVCEKLRQQRDSAV